jgi:hypothetical protein
VDEPRKPRVVTGTVSAELQSIGTAPPNQIPIEAARLVDVAPDEIVMAAPFMNQYQLAPFTAMPANGITVTLEHDWNEFERLRADRIRIVSPAIGQADVGIDAGAIGPTVTVSPPPWLVRA